MVNSQNTLFPIPLIKGVSRVHRYVDGTCNLGCDNGS